jgi:putative nucleotidyltransferase with HDIG domain
MKLSLKIFLSIIYTSVMLVIGLTLLNIELSDFNINDFIVWIFFTGLIFFVNMNSLQDFNTKVTFIIIMPFLLPALVYLELPYLIATVALFYWLREIHKPWYKICFNISINIISISAAFYIYSTFKNNLITTLSDEFFNIILLIIVCCLDILISNLLVCFVITLEKGTWDKSLLLPWLLISRSTFLVVIISVVNVYLYAWLGLIGVLASAILIFIAKPIIHHYVSQNNDLNSHTRLILTLLKHKDPHTYHHSMRVTFWTEMIARKLKLAETEVHQLSQAASWHDIGKIEVDSSVLNKDGKLNEEEYDIIKQHPELGYHLVKDLNFFKKFLNVIRYHHERYDGFGYPVGLKGEEIPYHARIVCVADSFDAMTMDRPYRCGMPMEKAVAELERCSGTHFDSKIVKAFVEALKEEYGKDYERWNKDDFVTA